MTVAYARTPVAAPGYPTDLTPPDAPLAPSGKLLSWVEAHALASDLHAPPGFREHTDARLWKRLTDAARLYVAERGEDHNHLGTVAAALAQVIEAARPGTAGD